MAERGGEQPRVRGREAVIGARAGAGWAGLVADRLAASFDAVASLIQAEARAARLAPWLPVAFGIGILLYFTAPAEPSLAAGGTAFVVLTAVTWVSRDRPAAFAVALGCAAIAAGFAAGSLRGAYVAHPVLARPTATLTLKGFVEQRDATERSERMVLRITGKEGRGADKVPPRIRLALRRGLAPAACGAPSIDRRMLATTGAMGLRRVEGKWIAEAARSPLADRPWYGRALPPDGNALARLERKGPAKPKSEAEQPLAIPGDVPVPELPEEPGR
jgi:competence protein ComEC